MPLFGLNVLIYILVATIVALGIREQTRSRIALFAGVLSWLVIGAPFILSSSGAKIENVEFPAFAGTVTVSGPADKLFTLNGTLNRVQRYSKDGLFEIGWFVDNPRNHTISIGITADEKIVVVRQRKAIFFEIDGSVARPSLLLPKAEISSSKPISANELEGIGVEIKNTERLNNPKNGFVALALFPLLHPLSALLLFGISMIHVIPARWRKFQGQPDK